MKNQIFNFSVIIGLCILIFATILVVSQSNQPDNSKTPAPTPIPTKTVSQQKLDCVVPDQRAPSPTPSITPTIGQQHRERTFESVVTVSKLLDWDCDGISNYDDNCRVTYNPDQKDSNKNGIGDACEGEKNQSVNSTAATPTPTMSPTQTSKQQKWGCSMPDLLKSHPIPLPKSSGMTAENARNIAKSVDWDCDGVSNYNDNCDNTFNPDQRDANRNGNGDACEKDPNNTRKVAGCSLPSPPAPQVPDGLVSTPEKVRSIAQSTDVDCDGTSNYDDNCPYKSNPTQADKNRNGIGDACERKKKKSTRKT